MVNTEPQAILDRERVHAISKRLLEAVNDRNKPDPQKPFTDLGIYSWTDVEITTDKYPGLMELYLPFLEKTGLFGPVLAVIRNNPIYAQNLHDIFVSIPLLLEVYGRTPLATTPEQQQRDVPISKSRISASPDRHLIEGHLNKVRQLSQDLRQRLQGKKYIDIPIFDDFALVRITDHASYNPEVSGVEIQILSKDKNLSLEPYNFTLRDTGLIDSARDFNDTGNIGYRFKDNIFPEKELVEVLTKHEFDSKELIDTLDHLESLEKYIIERGTDK